MVMPRAGWMPDLYVLMAYCRREERSQVGTPLAWSLLIILTLLSVLGSWSRVHVMYSAFDVAANEFGVQPAICALPSRPTDF